jgi:hypothetical protein
MKTQAGFDLFFSFRNKAIADNRMGMVREKLYRPFCMIPCFFLWLANLGAIICYSA